MSTTSQFFGGSGGGSNRALVVLDLTGPISNQEITPNDGKEYRAAKVYLDGVDSPDSAAMLSEILEGRTTGYTIDGRHKDAIFSRPFSSLGLTGNVPDLLAVHGAGTHYLPHNDNAGAFAVDGSTNTIYFYRTGTVYLKDLRTDAVKGGIDLSHTRNWLTWDSVNDRLIGGSGGNVRVFAADGSTETSISVAVSDVCGCVDPTTGNLILAESDGTITVYDGISDTVLTSFSILGGFVGGIAVDGSGNLWAHRGSGDTYLRRYVGLSDTEDETFEVSTHADYLQYDPTLNCLFSMDASQNGVETFTLDGEYLHQYVQLALVSQLTYLVYDRAHDLWVGTNDVDLVVDVFNSDGSFSHSYAAPGGFIYGLGYSPTTGECIVNFSGAGGYAFDASIPGLNLANARRVGEGAGYTYAYDVTVDTKRGQLVCDTNGTGQLGRFSLYGAPTLIAAGGSSLSTYGRAGCAYHRGLDAVVRVSSNKTMVATPYPAAGASEPNSRSSYARHSPLTGTSGAWRLCPGPDGLAYVERNLGHVIPANLAGVRPREVAIELAEVA